MLNPNEVIDGNLSEIIDINGALSDRNVILGSLQNWNTLDSTAIHYDTTANWNRQTFLIAERANFYVYTDAKSTVDELGHRIKIAGLKIGDGTSYLIDMPFAFYSDDHQTLIKHITDMALHVGVFDRVNWNEKVTAKINPEDGEDLILN